MQAKEESYLAGLPNIMPTNYQISIIVGSILGYGSLTYAKRSRNAYYREHFSAKQTEYRVWKAGELCNVGFKICNGNKLKSISHPIYSELYEKFYINGVKTVTSENIKMPNEVVGLACLYMDDGTLVVSKNMRKNVTINPSVSLYTLEFSEEENNILRDYLYETFNVNLYLKKHPDGKGFMLTTGKISEIINFLDIVKPYVSQIKSMEYKWNFEKRLQKVYESDNNVKKKDMNDRSFVRYTNNEIEKIIQLKKSSVTDKKIAEIVGKSYWGVMWKMRDLRRKSMS
ncbi:MAG: endonuclease [Thermoanaerobacteraceae bacterium]|nr:endonuclease [Thermoanaerobacteraceae bacterium]